MRITFTEPELPKAGALAIGILEDRKFLAGGGAADRRSRGALSRAMSASRFTGKPGQMLEIMVPMGLGMDRAVLYGLGKPGDIDATGIENAGGAVVGQLLLSGLRQVTFAAEVVEGAGLGVAEIAARLAFGAQLAGYRFDKYFTKQKPEQKPSLRQVVVTAKGATAAKAAYRPLEKVAEGVAFARDLVSEPGNTLHPAEFADRLRGLEALGVTVELYGEKQLAAMGFGALLGVGHGSVRESHLVVMEWKGPGAPEAGKPLCLVGKGVTFDTGGISIKPAGGMEDMKWDMAGAAAVAGTMKALAGRKASAHVVGLVGLVENMPSGSAQRPGDVVTSLSGQTIEVINTDAEGRLVLADVLWYAQDRFKPSAMVDLATLTGAIIVSLGHEHAGLFASDDPLADRLLGAGKAVAEPLWRMPLGAAYDKQIESPIADMKNIGGRDGGSITAAQFLQRFTKGVPWAHLDIAGMAWSSKAKPTVPKGATAFGVRLLDRLVRDHYEAK